MSTLLSRKLIDTRTVCILTAACGRAKCNRTDSVSVITSDELSTRIMDGIPADARMVQAMLHGRGWQTGKVVRCPGHVQPSWRPGAGVVPGQETS